MPANAAAPNERSSGGNDVTTATLSSFQHHHQFQLQPTRTEPEHVRPRIFLRRAQIRRPQPTTAHPRPSRECAKFRRRQQLHSCSQHSSSRLRRRSSHHPQHHHLCQHQLRHPFSQPCTPTPPLAAQSPLATASAKPSRVRLPSSHLDSLLLLLPRPPPPPHPPSHPIRLTDPTFTTSAAPAAPLRTNPAARRRARRRTRRLTPHLQSSGCLHPGRHLHARLMCRYAHRPPAWLHAWDPGIPYAAHETGEIGSADRGRVRWAATRGCVMPGSVARNNPRLISDRCDAIASFHLRSLVRTLCMCGVAPSGPPRAVHRPRICYINRCFRCASG